MKILGSKFSVIIFWNVDLFRIFHKNFTYLSHFNWSPYLLNIQISYLFTNSRCPQILISRSQKVMFFVILGNKKISKKFSTFFFLKLYIFLHLMVKLFGLHLFSLFFYRSFRVKKTVHEYIYLYTHFYMFSILIYSILKM